MNYKYFMSCIESGRLQLGLWDKLHHYSIVLVSGFMVMLGCYFLLISKGHAEFERSLNIIFFSVPVAVIFYFIQWRRLRFIIIESPLTQDEIAGVIKITAQKLGWEKKTQGGSYYTAARHDGPFFKRGSWGEQITILMRAKKIYFNSICDLSKRPSVTAWGRNRENAQVFIRELKKAEARKAIIHSPRG